MILTNAKILNFALENAVIREMGLIAAHSELPKAQWIILVLNAIRFLEESIEGGIHSMDPSFSWDHACKEFADEFETILNDKGEEYE